MLKEQIKDHLINKYVSIFDLGPYRNKSVDYPDYAKKLAKRVKDKKYPNTVCDVIHQAKKWKGKLIRNKCQFSYYCDGKSEKYKELDALLQVIDTSELILQGVMLEQTIGATHYHTWKVSPHWSRSPNFIKLGRVGSHIFYIDKSK